MVAERQTILHSDMNSFYASIEAMLDPSLKGKAIAVCGATEDRHGIVLAKSEKAKKRGVKTGMVNFEARQKCPDLILVPPQYDQYLKYSKLAHEIYYRYTDQVEPFGMDECWLDVSHSVVGSGLTIAEEIRRSTREELGLTVSIGVSFNKIFAKLGRDMKKPDAITTISPDDFKEKVWPLPASDLLYVGRSTEHKLSGFGIHTIGELAATPPEIQFYGANRTGRYAGRLIQVQNLPQNHLPDLDNVRNLICTGQFDAVEMLYDSVPLVLSELIRTAFIPKPGCRFYVADFSAIEARVIAWIAGETWRQEVFASGGDIYCASASQMFHVPVVKHGINGHLRQKGKIAELALGYGGSTGALKAMGALNYGVSEEELKPLVDA